MGLTNCSERCVNLTDDPDNCGGCAIRCGSGLCLGGACQLEGVGHVVVIGHDYVVNRTGMNNIIGNSVFLSGDDPVTVLTYEGAASPESITGTNFAIDQVANARGRRWTRQVAQRGDVAAGLATADTFLIYAQQGASDATLLQLGIDWGSTLRTFVNSGHTVVVLDGPSTNNMGTFQILTTALLFTALGRTEVTGQTLSVVAGGDAVAVRVPRSYRAEMASVAFTTLEAVKVIQTMTGEAVVIHKIFRSQRRLLVASDRLGGYPGGPPMNPLAVASPIAARTVHQDDALDWLARNRPLVGASVITSLPDTSELPELSLEDWQGWFVRAAALTMSSVDDQGAAIFFQSDIRHRGVWIDKAALVQTAAAASGMKLLFHKIVCRKPPGTSSQGRATYSHLLGVRARGPAAAPADARRVARSGFRRRAQGHGHRRLLAGLPLHPGRDHHPHRGRSVLRLGDGAGRGQRSGDGGGGRRSVGAHVPAGPGPGAADSGRAGDAVTTLQPRAACGRCGRPVVVCFCDRITLLPTRHRLLLLQHPRERRMGIGTARLAHLALPGSQLRVGLDFSTDPVVRALLAQPPAYVLFPGPQALPPEQLPGDRPITLVVLDGTWAQARKLLTLNPAIAALPRVAFRPRRPSAYEIRRQPAEFCLSTIEALAEVLERLEPDAGGLRAPAGSVPGDGRAAAVVRDRGAIAAAPARVPAPGAHRRPAGPGRAPGRRLGSAGVRAGRGQRLGPPRSAIASHRRRCTGWLTGRRPVRVSPR